MDSQMKRASFEPDLQSFRMKEFEIPVIWEMCAKVKVFAISQEDAVLHVLENLKEIPEGTYLNESFRVDDDVLADQ